MYSLLCIELEEGEKRLECIKYCVQRWRRETRGQDVKILRREARGILLRGTNI